MTWPPQHEKKVFDLTAIVDNLLAYLEANDADALEWANDATPGLQEFQAFYSNASGRLNTIFPSCMVIAKRHATDLKSDAIDGGLELTLEITLAGPDADQLATDANRYARAIESMLSNIPSGTLTNGVGQTTQSHLFELETRFDVVGRLAGTPSFIQVFQTQATYQLITSGV
jgi:hypothetical protein